LSENESQTHNVDKGPASPLAGADFERLLDIYLGKGGTSVSTVEAYFNDSGTHPGSPVLCVAGYVFDKERAINFDREWRALLGVYHLPYFRMSACAHGSEPFNELSAGQRAALELNLVAIVNKWMTCGLAITVQPDVLGRILSTRSGLAESPFSYCARFILTSVRRRIEEKKIVGDCAYVFESGHQSQDEANEIMHRLYLDAKLRRAHRYLSHAFISKSIATPLQAADMLAWQWYTDSRRRIRGEAASRPGAQALFEGGSRREYTLLHSDELSLRGWAMKTRDKAQLFEF
jgi:hypothetical protein